MFTAISMAICLLVVFVYVVYKTRQINVSGSDGYFLAGSSLTGGVICATILLTNLSTEQLVGLSGQVYSSNMGPMAWEAPACIGAIGLAFIFLPHYFRQGVMTVPEFLETRYDAGVKKLVAFLLLATYLLTFLPTVLYSGALVFEQMFNVGEILNISHFTAVALVTFILGLVGAFYTIVGGVKASASADTIYGILFAIGGCAVPIFALIFLGNGNFLGSRLRNLPQSTQQPLLRPRSPGQFCLLAWCLTCCTILDVINPLYSGLWEEKAWQKPRRAPCCSA